MTTELTHSIALDDIVSTANVAALVADGYIRERTHPDDPGLLILNYTEKAQYERVWNHETQTCRGIIVDRGEVVARPWSKFFNYGEHPDGALDMDAPVEVTDKLDGSLGILYRGPAGWAIATRGSFASEQALHATEVLRERYEPRAVWLPTPGLTYLFEIIYPANRIVVDYGPLDDLSLLGAVRISDGHTFGPDDLPEWPGTRAQTFPARTLAEALALAPRPNAEGVVVRYPATGLMVKIKQDDYVRLHRIVTGLNERVVWEHLRDNAGDYTALLAVVPDEFHGWVRQHAEALIARHTEVLLAARSVHAALADGRDRKDYAIAVREQAPDLAPYCFNLLDGRDPALAIWKSLRPVGVTASLLNHTEDVA